ncbi:MAG: ABC transporter substrate-binding protein [Ilumatobacteraceae bacterium]
MKTRKRSVSVVALAAGLALIAAACGSDKKSETTSAASAPTTAGVTTTAGATTTEGGASTTEAPGATSGTASSTPASGSGMKLTYEINPKAVWDDGSPITVKDFQCTFEATMGTTGTLTTTGYDQITSVDQGASDHEVVVTLKSVYAPYKNLFANPGPLKAAAFPNGCKDISADLQDSIPFSSRPYKLDSWSPDQAVLTKNDKYWGDDTAKVSKVVIVPKTDTDTELASLKSGEVDFIFPQAANGITEALDDPNIKYTPGYGVQYESLWFQQKTGPFSDPAFRKGFAHMIDRDEILKNIYDPLFPGSELLNCGAWVPTIGKWCDQSDYANFHDEAAGEKFLTDGGYTKNSSGMWEKDGKVPEIRWVITAGNKRREDTQALMIPEFKKLGFNVVQDNCDAACVFQKRLPALDYDLAMYIWVASPDPTVTTILACENIPSDANQGAGQNTAAWCNEEATDLMHQSDAELDVSKREEEIHQIGKLMVDDAVSVPLYQFPNIAAWRTDKLDGPVDADAANYQAFQNINEWTVKSGDQITVGAEQWPDCINPITQCANSSWAAWTTFMKVVMNAYDTTAAGDFAVTPLLTGEPKVEVLS